MTAPESTIDRRIDRAVEFYLNSELSLKSVAILAGSIVGKYDGTTQELASRVKRSVSRVEDWAHAYWLYRTLRATPYKTVVRDLWRELPITHWCVAYDDIHRVGGNALKYLANASFYDWSSRDMIKEFRVDWERIHGAPPPVTPDKHLQRARGIVEHILANLDSFDAAIVEWARMGLNLIGGQNDTR